eukprot:scaffold16256_cov75-Phaeocystis_antarctica.AAC.1
MATPRELPLVVLTSPLVTSTSSRASISALKDSPTICVPTDAGVRRVHDRAPPPPSVLHLGCVQTPAR